MLREDFVLFWRFAGECFGGLVGLVLLLGQGYYLLFICSFCVCDYYFGLFVYVFGFLFRVCLLVVVLWFGFGFLVISLLVVGLLLVWVWVVVLNGCGALGLDVFSLRLRALCFLLV